MNYLTAVVGEVEQEATQDDAEPRRPLLLTVHMLPHHIQDDGDAVAFIHCSPANILKNELMCM